MKPYIYLRGLRHVDLSVFCVENGQKSYWDQIFKVNVPFSSGQQVKRCMLEMVSNELNVNPAEVTFVFDVNNKGKLGEGEVLSLCDPQYFDQLLGGWMRVPKGGETKTLKRRSPFSISAMRPLHPLLGGTSYETVTFDRSDRPESNKVIVRDSQGRHLSENEIQEFLEDTNRSLYRKWIPDNPRATGLFVYDVAIDLRTLFCVSVNQMESEISKEKVEELQAKGWILSENVFGECLVMPKEERVKVIPAIAKALINWRITSNQARTFSLMETLAVAISDNANTLAGTIYAKLSDEVENKAIPIICENKGSDLFVTLPCSGYVVTKNESADALQKAEERLVELLSSFDYEHQVVGTKDGVFGF